GAHQSVLLFPTLRSSDLVLEEYSDILSNTTKEMIEKEKSSLEQSLEVVQNYAERANEIRQREANSAVDISAETGKMLSDLSRARSEEHTSELQSRFALVC